MILNRTPLYMCRQCRAVRRRGGWPLFSLLGFFCVNGMEPIWTLLLGLGITLIYVDWLHYYVHCESVHCVSDTGGGAARIGMSMPTAQMPPQPLVVARRRYASGVPKRT